MIRRELPPYCQRRGKSGFVYFERRGFPSQRIKAEPGTPEFHAEYARILAGRAPVAPGKTFKALIAHYRRSHQFEALAPRTKADYDKVLRFIDDRMGHLPVAGMRHKDVYRAQDANRQTVRFANYLVQILRVLFAHAMRIGWRDDNPAKGVEMLKSKSDPRLPWPADMIAAYRAAADGRARLIFELCLGTGQRIGDVLRMRWNDVEAGGIHVRQGKTRKALWVPFTSHLRAALDATQRRGLTIICTDAGLALTYHQARHIVGTIREKIGAGAYDLHSLRYTAASELAALGCSDELIMSVTGHSSGAMVAHYAGPARQKSRATEAQGKRG
jgi:integrase